MQISSITNYLMLASQVLDMLILNMDLAQSDRVQEIQDFLFAIALLVVLTKLCPNSHEFYLYPRSFGVIRIFWSKYLFSPNPTHCLTELDGLFDTTKMIVI